MKRLLHQSFLPLSYLHLSGAALLVIFSAYYCFQLPEQRAYFPLYTVMIVLGMTVSTAFKVQLDELFLALHYRERVGITFLYITCFLLGGVAIPYADIRHSLLFLLLPLSFMLIGPRSFNALYLMAAAIFSISFLKYPVSFLTLEIFVFLLLSSFLLDYLRFRAEEFSLQMFLPPAHLALLIVRFVVPALVALLVLHFMLPSLRPHRMTVVSSDADYGIAPGSSFSPSEIFTLAAELVGLIIATFLGLAFLSWLRKQLAKRRSLWIANARSSIKKIKTVIEHTVPRRWRLHLSSARSALIYHYCLFCEEMNTFGWGRQPHQTPAEYNRFLKQHLPHLASLLDFITQQFEAARYSPYEPALQVVREFTRRIDEVVETLKARAPS